MTIVEALKTVKTSETSCRHNCAEAMKLAVKRAGYDDSFFSISCTETRKLLRTKACTQFQEITNPKDWKPNDIILFNWYYKTQTDAEHIAVVSRVEGDTIYYDDFNSDNNPRGYYAGHSRKMGDPYIDSHFRPLVVNNEKATETAVTYKAKSVDIHLYDMGAIVKLIQSITGAEVDGQYGPKTQACVKKFQTKRGIDSDGWVGTETLTEMAKYIQERI